MNIAPSDEPMGVGRTLAAIGRYIAIAVGIYLAVLTITVHHMYVLDMWGVL